MKTPRYTYRLRRTNTHETGRVCILTADIERVVAAVDGERAFASAVSDKLLSPVELYALQQSLEPGVLLEVSESRLVELNAVAAAADLYRQWPYDRAVAAGLVPERADMPPFAACSIPIAEPTETANGKEFV
jgi:hypothetical protein